MSEFQVHHVKFCNYVPSGIQSLAYNQTDKVLAVGREDNSVEIWKTGEGRKWLQQKVIPGSEKRKVNSLVWVKGRLFSAGLQGDITEYDLQHLKPKKSIYYGNAFWCIAVNHAQTHIAAGCEDGYIRLYEMTDEGLIYDRSLQMQQGRVVSLAWHVSDEVIVTGSLDNIRIWNVNTGHATLRITTQRVQKHTEVVVWQVAVLDDMTIVSGDSVGRTQFWNGKHGTLLKSYTSHRASVLDLCVSQDQTSVFSAGVDPIISEFQMVQKASGSETKHWVRGRSIRDHSHDVMAVVIAGDKLVSGGVDTMLAVNPVHIEMSGGKPSKAMSRLRHRIRGFPHKLIVTLAPKARMLLLQYSHSLEVWKLGNTQASSDEDGKVLPLSEKPVKLLELRAKGMEQIVCSTISSCGTWVAYSDVEKIRFYHITLNPLSITRVPTIPSNLHPAHHLAFTPDSSKLVSAVGTGSAGLQLLTVDGPDGVDCPQPLVQSIPITEVQGPYTALAVSGDGERVAVVGSEGKVAVLPLNSNKIKSVVLPHTKAHPCCLAFHPSSKQLAVAYTDRNIAEYDITKHEYTPWSRSVHKQGLHQAWLEKTSVIHQLTFDPSDPDKLLVQDGTWLTVIDKTKPLPRANERLLAPRGGKRRHDGTSRGSEDRTHGFSICKKYKTIMFVGTLEDPGQLVLVERPQQAIFEQLPPTLQQKKFGT